jgi:hypothetical protein
MRKGTIDELMRLASKYGDILVRKCSVVENCIVFEIDEKSLHSGYSVDIEKLCDME